MIIVIIRIFITKPQLKSYLQSTYCYKKSSNNNNNNNNNNNYYYYYYSLICSFSFYHVNHICNCYLFVVFTFLYVLGFHYYYYYYYNYYNLSITSCRRRFKKNFEMVFE